MNDKPNSEKSNQDSFILVKDSQKSLGEDIKLTQSANLIQSVLINSLESQIANLKTEFWKKNTVWDESQRHESSL